MDGGYAMQLYLTTLFGRAETLNDAVITVIGNPLALKWRYARCPQLNSATKSRPLCISVKTWPKRVKANAALTIS